MLWRICHVRVGQFSFVPRFYILITHTMLLIVFGCAGGSAIVWGLSLAVHYMRYIDLLEPREIYLQEASPASPPHCALELTDCHCSQLQ